MSSESAAITLGARALHDGECRATATALVTSCAAVVYGHQSQKPRQARECDGRHDGEIASTTTISARVSPGAMGRNKGKRDYATGIEPCGEKPENANLRLTELPRNAISERPHFALRHGPP